jgi:iron complex outermembrane receptor protein
MRRPVWGSLLPGNGASAQRRCIIAALSIALAALSAGVAAASPELTSGSEDSLSEVVVTARQRAESLQSVPDSVTAITSTTIERAGIQQVADFANLVPNMTFRETFREGASYITIRGVTTPQGGWAPVTYVVDGVPAGSADAINTGALVGIERIEVLKGPQSAIYGSGAIAGAVNIITRAPSDHLEGEAQAWYGNYGDERGVLMVSGPVADRVKFRVDAFYRHSDGSQEDTDGLGMNFNRTGDVRGKLLIDLAPVQLDLRLHYVDTHAGAAYQEFLPPGDAGSTLIDNFDASPGIQRGIRGYEDVRNIEGSIKAEWNAGFATLTSLSAYSKLDDSLFGTTSWQKPPGASFCGTVGNAGEPPDCAQSSEDNFKVFTQDVRLTSASDQALRWLIGTSYLHREAPNALLVGGAALDPSGNVVAGASPFVNSTYLRHDNFAGVYGQVNYDITHALEATAALRWDQNRYNSTQYTSLSLQTPVTLPDGTVTQRKTDAAVQPKFQLSYHWTDDLMTYATAAKGFRSGFFYSGNFTKAESTWNAVRRSPRDAQPRCFPYQLLGSAVHIDHLDAALPADFKHSEHENQWCRGGAHCTTGQCPDPGCRDRLYRCPGQRRHGRAVHSALHGEFIGGAFFAAYGRLESHLPRRLSLPGRPVPWTRKSV